MRTFNVLLKKDFLELWRTKKILALAIVFVLFGFMSPVMANLMPLLFENMDMGGLEFTIPEPTILDSYAQLQGNLVQMVAWIMMGIFGGLIVSERLKGQYTNLRNNGVQSRHFILAKVVSQIILVTACYVLAVLAFSLYNFILFDAFFIPGSLVFFTGFYVLLLFFIALITLYGTLLKSAVAVTISAIVTTLLLDIFNFWAWGRFLPSGVSRLSAEILMDTTVRSDLFQGMAVTIGISLLLIALSVRLCGNKE